MSGYEAGNPSAYVQAVTNALFPDSGYDEFARGFQANQQHPATTLQSFAAIQTPAIPTLLPFSRGIFPQDTRAQRPMRSIDTTLATRVFSGLPTPARLNYDPNTPRGVAFQQNQAGRQPSFTQYQLVSPADSQFSPNRVEQLSRASGARRNSNDTADDDENGSEDAAPAATQGRARWHRQPYGPRTTAFLSNGERARYHQLSDYPLADTPLPAGTTCLDIITRYPNHFGGENLEAFLQYFWSAEMIVRLTPIIIKDLWKSQAIHGPNSRPANFIRNRMDAYAERMGRDGLRRLIAEPKKRPSGLPSYEEYGRSDPMGLGLNNLRPRTARTGPRKTRVVREPESTTVVQPSALPPVNPAPAPAPVLAAPPLGINSGSINLDTSGVAQAAVMNETAPNHPLVAEGDDAEPGPADAAAPDTDTITQQ